MITTGILVSLIRELFLRDDASVEIAPDTKLLREGICDSLGLVKLAVELERKYPPLCIHDQDINWENFDSIKSILRFLGEKGVEIGG